MSDEDNFIIGTAKRVVTGYAKAAAKRAGVYFVGGLLPPPFNAGLIGGYEAYEKFNQAKSATEVVINAVKHGHKFVSDRKKQAAKDSANPSSSKTGKQSRPSRVSTPHPYGRGKKKTYTPNPRGTNQYTKKRSMSTGANGGGSTSESDGSATRANKRTKRSNSDSIEILDDDAGTQGGLVNTLTPVNRFMRTNDSESFSRVFHHYIDYSPHKGWVEVGSTEKYFKNEDWFYLPYNWLNCALTPRDYQAINIRYKTWHVKSFGFQIHHVVPFIDDLKSSDPPKPTVEISPLSWFEVFADFDHELPKFRAEASALPNTSMQQPFGDRSNCTLKKLPLSFEPKDKRFRIHLEQSPNFSTVDASDGFSYVHHVDPVDIKNMHSLWPVNNRMMLHHTSIVDSAYVQPILGVRNCDEGDNYKLIQRDTSVEFQRIKDNMTQAPLYNRLWESFQFHAPHKPPPAILLRVPRIDRKNDVLSPFAFSFYCTYFCEIEGTLVNTVPQAIKCSVPSSTQVFKTEELLQPTGGDSHRFIFQDRTGSTPDMK